MFELIPVGLLALGAVLLVWGVRTRRRDTRPPRHWVPVAGRVIATGDQQRVEYRTPKGRRVELRFSSRLTYAEGQEVDLLVDPVDSSQARLVDAERAADSVARTLMVTGGILVVAGALAALAFG